MPSLILGELEVLHGGTVVHTYGPGDSFGESSLLFSKPRSSTVRCISESCRIHEMTADDFMAVVNSNEDTAAALRNMCRKRLFKKAVKQFSLHKNRGLSDDDIVAAFHDADLDEVSTRMPSFLLKKRWGHHHLEEKISISSFV